MSYIAAGRFCLHILHRIEKDLSDLHSSEKVLLLKHRIEKVLSDLDNSGFDMPFILA